jgi:hypothetical protein
MRHCTTSFSLLRVPGPPAPQSCAAVNARARLRVGKGEIVLRISHHYGLSGFLLHKNCAAVHALHSLRAGPPTKQVTNKGSAGIKQGTHVPSVLTRIKAGSHDSHNPCR